MSATSLEQVLHHPSIWRGNACARVATPSVSTGYAELDAELPGGGWPTGAVTEIHAERPGIGELNLVMPAMSRLTRDGRWIALLAPPYVPYAPALAHHGIQLDRLMMLQPKTKEDRLWACEQVLRSSSCGAALLWLDQAHERSLRRLQLAAEAGGTTLFLYRPTLGASTSMAALRLHVAKEGSLTTVRILKRRGGGLPSPIMLDLHGRLIDRALVQRTARVNANVTGAHESLSALH
jgi:hypothetical protein